MNNLSKEFIDTCNLFNIDVSQENKDSLRLKIEDKLEEYQNKLNSCVGISYYNEGTHLSIPMELNNKIYKIKGLYNEYMNLFYS